MQLNKTRPYLIVYFDELVIQISKNLLKFVFIIFSFLYVFSQEKS